MITEENLQLKFDHIYKVVSSKGFLSMESLGGEIPFWISAYNPRQEVEVSIQIKHLQTKLKNNGVQAHVVNLFDLMVKLIDRHLGLQKLQSIETRKSKDQYKKALRSTINIHERLIPEIKKEVDEAQAHVLLICGVGGVFPIMRSHTILNNLQSSIKEIPTVMFFPGNYTGRSMQLFGLLKDDNYYRAFNIDEHKMK